MKLLKAVLIRMFSLYRYTYFGVHILILAVSALLYFLMKHFVDYQIIESNFVLLVNGMGVMTTFFILTVEKVDFKALKDAYPTLVNVAFAKEQISEGKKVLNLIYSITLTKFLLLLTQYVLIFFGQRSMLLLISLIMYIFSGFIIILSVWHSLELKK